MFILQFLPRTDRLEGWVVRHPTNAGEYCQMRNTDGINRIYRYLAIYVGGIIHDFFELLAVNRLILISPCDAVIPSISVGRKLVSY